MIASMVMFFLTVCAIMIIWYYTEERKHGPMFLFVSGVWLCYIHHHYDHNK